MNRQPILVSLILLATGGGGIIVIHHDQQVVGLVEHGIADTAGEPVVPEPAVAHDPDGPAISVLRVQR